MKLEAFVEQFKLFVEDDPNFCAFLGVSKNLGSLPDPGKNKRIQSIGKIKSLKNLIKRIDRDELNKDELIDLRLYDLYLDQLYLSYELMLGDVPHNMRLPKATQDITDPLFMFFINDDRNPNLRLVNIISRLEKVDQFLTSYMRNIKSPVKRWVDMELERIPGTKDFFEQLYNWAESIEFKNLKAFRKVITSANSSLLRYETFLKNTSTSDSIFIGEEQMYLILKSKGIELSADELFQVAKNFIKRNTEEIENLRVRLCKKYALSDLTSAKSLQEFFAKEFAVKESGDEFQYILDRYQSEHDEILSFINKADLFPIMEDQSMQIIQTPKFMEPTIPAGAMMAPYPLKTGEKKSLVYLTLSRDLLPEHTEISIPGMMIHEGIPGHHLQFSWAANNESYIRRIFGSNDLQEGWTTMLEDYMFDAGYKEELADEIRFVTKRDIARIGARVAIDLYFMSGEKRYLDIGVECDLSSDDPFVCAGNLLAAVTGFVSGRVQAELNWYSQERGYPLSYLTGNHLVWELKEKFVKLYNRDGDKSVLECDKEFHKRFLRAGNMPVSLLHDYILN